MFYSHMNDTPVGRLLIACDDDGLKHISFAKTHFSSREITPDERWELSERRLKEPIRQLKAYFAGKLRAFDLLLAADGTDFQKCVWQALCRIPIAIIVPCHRIIGKNGKLVGYGGGLEHKQSLLKLEGFVEADRGRMLL